MAGYLTGAALPAVVLLMLAALAHGRTADKWDLEELMSRDKALPQKRLFSCKSEKTNCYGFPRCCGDLSCYWKDGYSPFRPGTCVMCIEKGLACQRDSGCCAGLICDKDDRLYLNGICNAPRTKGTCYRSDQCLYSCERPYYKSQGHCTSSPPSS